MRYFKFPKWLKRFYPNAIWDFFYTNCSQPKLTNAKTIYLTFDDGPNPKTTEWLLDLLGKYNAKATFFCLGKNVENNPKLYAQLIKNKHAVGNHSYNHLNGIHTETTTYIEDVLKAKKVINSTLFRPPYGKMKPAQYKKLQKLGFTTVFWSHITYDFDTTYKSEKRVENTLKRVKNGSIVVFHDSKKAFPQLKKELPVLLKKWQKQGYQFKAIKT